MKQVRTSSLAEIHDDLHHKYAVQSTSYSSTPKYWTQAASILRLDRVNKATSRRGATHAFLAGLSMVQIERINRWPEGLSAKKISRLSSTSTKFVAGISRGWLLTIWGHIYVWNLEHETVIGTAAYCSLNSAAAYVEKGAPTETYEVECCNDSYLEVLAPFSYS